MDIKSRLKRLNLNQVWLLKQLRERGYDVQPPFLSATINELYTYPKSKAVLKACDEILKDVETENERVSN